MHTYITITTWAIMRLKECSAPTARKELQRVREVLKLAKREPLMLKDLAAVWGTSCFDLANELYNTNKKMAA
jgi:hypothetical protein